MHPTRKGAALKLNLVGGRVMAGVILLLNGGEQNRTMTNEELIRRALAVVNPREITHGLTVGDVGCALLTGTGNLHVGVCIDTIAGIGFCAEHSAIASMVTHGEQSIRKIVAVQGDGTILPPCGRCREFMHQIDTSNMDRTEVLLGSAKAVKLRDLLPHPWDEVC
ncbi:MAG: cytidine deaminase [Acidobacteria bacterium]|nr:cytidine deaminase [Acidobacteriota bacterium]